MVKFISIPNTLSATAPFLFNVANIMGVVYATSATFLVYADGKTFTFTVAGGNAALTAATVNAVNKAILSPAGPIVVEVAMPAGATIAAVPAIS